MENGSKKVIKGKRKIAMEAIISKTKKQVTFSKRRAGLFKKASELCSMCGVEAAIITFSNGGKLYSFGHPNADAVIRRYINTTTTNDVGDFNDQVFKSQIGQYKDVLAQIDVEKTETKVKTETKFMAATRGYNTNNNNNNSQNWWDQSIDDLGLSDLERYKAALEGLRNKVSSKVDQIIHDSSMISKSSVPQDFDFDFDFDFGSAADRSVVGQGFDCSADVNREDGLTDDDLLDLLLSNC